MVSIGSLWLVILASAALVWVASAVMWMVMPHHKSDFGKISDESAARAALKGIAPGSYVIPYCATPEDRKSEDYQVRVNEGPVGMLHVLPNGPPSMPVSLVSQFLFFLLVSLVVAYVAGRTLAPGTPYLLVFQVSGTVAWLGYAWAGIPESIWFGRPWSVTLKHMADGLVYSLLAAGVFASMWP
ncbi:MAG: hypothetical protein LJE84_05220 [Gammaproteobacteria bacterium]|nr:hypothetical protein [Gammaproteobacteria bacterium]